MTDKVQKIREGVERLKSQLLRGACSSQIAMETRCKEEAYNDVLAILDTMQEEHVSEDLEEAAKQFATDTESGKVDIVKQSAFFWGAICNKQQMIAKAVDVTVHIDNGNYPYIPQIELYDYDKDIPLAKEGDKYKVILIKEG